MATLIPAPAGDVSVIPASRLGALEAARQAALLRVPSRPADLAPSLVSQAPLQQAAG